MEQEIHFCTKGDGAQIAYSIVGEGPPLVYARPVWGHLELEWERAEIRSYFLSLARHHTVFRWDTHGTGLSDRAWSSFDLSDNVADMEAMIEHVGLKQFDLVGDATGGPTAISLAAARPDLVNKLALYGTFAYGPAVGRPEILGAMLSLIRANWSVAAKTFADMIVPDVDAETARSCAILLRDSCEPEVAARLYELAWTVDVRNDLARIKSHTLVLHRRGDKTAPFELGRALASQIPGARFVPLEGKSNLPYIGNPTSVLRGLADFLETPPPVDESPAPVTILLTDIEGSTALTQRLGDAGAQKVQRAHDDIVRRGTAAYGGRELKHTGDGIMVSFASSSAAIECAIAVQRSFGEWNETYKDQQLRVRIGISAGEISGPAEQMNTAYQLATRVCSRAQPGAILVTDAVRQLVAGQRFDFTDAGRAALKGFTERVRLYEVHPPAEVDEG
jgi:class 3 adenylate cyclase/pimeloyl-ACP methyl ester carboxylesterase